MSVLVLLVGGVVGVAGVAFAARLADEVEVDTAREWRAVQGVLLASVVVGAAVAGAVAGGFGLGRGLVLVPAVLGCFVVAGVALSETVVRPARPEGVRTASLAPRRVSDYVQRHLASAVVGITALHAATLVLTTATASADDLGRAGRRVVATCGDTGSGAGPYPGTFYSVPLALVLLSAGAATAAALAVVVRRPRGFAGDDVGDDALRVRSTTRVLAAFGAAVAASHAGVALFTGSALLRMECQDAWMAPVGLFLTASVPVAVVLLGWFLTRLVRQATVPSAPDLVAGSRPR